MRRLRVVVAGALAMGAMAVGVTFLLGAVLARAASRVGR